MISYSDLLKKYIECSQLSLSQIEEKIREKGLATNKAYISKLQNGKLPPAGDEINKALAAVLGGNEEELMLASYSERAPVLKDLINTLIDSFKSMILNNKELFIEMMGGLENQPNENFENMIDHAVSTMSFKEKIEMISFLSDNLKSQQLSNFTEFQDGILRINLTEEEEYQNFPDIPRKNKGKSLSNLTSDEHLFLTEQLELYRKLELNRFPNSEQNTGFGTDVRS